MCLDPRGYGVCRILYAGSRAYTGEPTAMHAAEALCKAIHPGDPVYILVGFVLLPHKVPEMARFCQRDPAGAVSGIGLWGKADHRLPAGQRGSL